MKKRYSLLLVVCFLALTTVLGGCGSSKSVDEQFKADLMKGLSARWDLTDKESEDKSPTKSDYEAYIAAEYDVVSKYKDETFEDEELGELVKSYIEVLERSEATLDDFGNTDKWNVIWYDVRDDRVEILLKLNDKLDLQFSDESDKENWEGLLSEGKVVKSVREM